MDIDVTKVAMYYLTLDEREMKDLLEALTVAFDVLPQSSVASRIESMVNQIKICMEVDK